MSGNKVAVIILIVLVSIIILPLGITSIVLGAVKPGSCDYKDSMGLDIGQYLIGLGVANCALCVIIIAHIIWIVVTESKVAIFSATILIFINALFGLAWFIIGGVILYRDNIQCIKQGSAHVIFALVLWCLTALQLFGTFGKIRIKCDCN